MFVGVVGRRRRVVRLNFNEIDTFKRFQIGLQSITSKSHALGLLLSAEVLNTKARDGPALSDTELRLSELPGRTLHPLPVRISHSICVLRSPWCLTPDLLAMLYAAKPTSNCLSTLPQFQTKQAYSQVFSAHL